jgi:hypothetical protein
MILQYGSYRHGQNEVAISISSEELRTQSEVLYGFRQRWTLTAFPGLEDSTQQNLTADIQALVNAYSQDGGDLVLYLDDGVTPSAHTLRNANTLGGTHARPISFPTGTGAEYSTYRSYSMEVWGDVPLTGNNLLLEYEEHFETTGNGGPINVAIPVATSPAIMQQTAAFSPVHATQSGRAKGLYAYPQPMQPIFPSLLVNQSVVIHYGSPRLRRNSYYEFPVAWTYPYLTNIGLQSTPNFQPVQSP